MSIPEESTFAPKRTEGPEQLSAVSFITQPTYLPWIGIFRAIQLADIFIFYDDVQFERHSWQNRNHFLDPFMHKPAMLTVPLSKYHRDTVIRDIKIAAPDFYEDHICKLRAWYSRAPFLEPTLDVLREVYAKRFARLVELSSELTMALARYLGLRTRFGFAHDFDIRFRHQQRPDTLPE